MVDYPPKYQSCVFVFDSYAISVVMHCRLQINLHLHLDYSATITLTFFNVMDYFSRAGFRCLSADFPTIV